MPSDPRVPLRSPYTATTYNSLWGSGPNDIFVVGGAGAIYHYDGTSQWSSLGPLATDPGFRALIGVAGSSSNDVFAISGDRVWRYTGR